MAFLTRTLSVDLPYVILTVLTVPVRVARMEDFPNERRNRQHRACSESCVLRRWHRQCSSRSAVARRACC